jgi:hypothetical protein
MATLPQGTKTLGLIEDIPTDQYQRLLGSRLLKILLECPHPECVDYHELREFLARAASESEVLFHNIEIIALPGRNESFSADDNFFVGTSPKAKVPISSIGETFTKSFGGKIEEKIAATKIGHYELKNPSRSILILNRFGGEDKVEITLGEAYALMEKYSQPQASRGVAAINYQCYVRDINKELMAVGWNWGGNGLDIVANLADSSYKSFYNQRVFVRLPASEADSVLKT